MSEWKHAAEQIKAAIKENQKDSEKRFNWLKEYARRGNPCSHIAAGQALASAVIAASVLGGKDEIILKLIYNPREGQIGREDFRFDFARHALLLLLDGYEKDNLSALSSQLDAASGAVLLSMLLEALAYESGQLAEDIQSP